MSDPAPTTAPSALFADDTPSYFTEAWLLALAARVVPDWYIAPLISPGPGYEVLRMFAKIFERASKAVGTAERSLFVMSAQGGQYAIGQVTFYRQNAAAGAFTILPGTIVRATRSGREFVVYDPIEFGALDLTKAGGVQAVAYGAEYNELGKITTADGTVLPGEVDFVAVPLLDPPLAEPTIQVRQDLGDIGSGHSSGRAAVLDQIGADRGINRHNAELDERYRGRISQLPDTISPAAIRRQLDSIFLPRGLTYDYIETWENRYQACWDAPEGGPVSPIFGPLYAWAYDDPRSDTFAGRWMGIEDERGAFVVVVPEVGPMQDMGFAFDDPADTDADRTYPSGRRAIPAWTIPDVLASGILPGVWDGYDEPRNAFFRDLYALLRDIHGGGVTFSIELQGE